MGCSIISAAAGTGRAQCGQMQARPRRSGGSRCNASGATGRAMHQHCAGARPAAMAHWLDWPHRGHWALLGSGMAAV